jgi:hypothetical protein
MPKLKTTIGRTYGKTKALADMPTFGLRRANLEQDLLRMGENANARKAQGGIMSGAALALEHAKAIQFGADRHFHLKGVRVGVANGWWTQAAKAFKIPMPPMRMYFGGDIHTQPAPVQDEKHYPFGREHAPGPYLGEYTCELPPTDDPVEIAVRGARGSRYSLGDRKDFEARYRSERIRRHRVTVKALHSTLNRMGFLGIGASRTVYALGKHTVLKVPNDASWDNFEANLNELRMWKKHRRRATIKLAACRLHMILGVPCLIMQRVRVPGRDTAEKGDTRPSQAPIWAMRLGGYQCALTERGEWVAYDYGYQRERDIVAPFPQDEYERRESTRRSSNRAEAAE